MMIDHASPTETTAAPKRGRRWLRWAVPAVTLFLGVGLGFTAAGGDPTRSDQYQELSQKWQEQRQELDDAEGLIEAADERAAAAEASGDTAETTASAVAAAAEARSVELATREAAVTAREEAVAAVEAQVAATSVGEGTWTVGVNIEPGTYRTPEAAPADCYWSITASGSNSADIIQNDIPGGGFPTVTLAAGQDFTNHRCGTFVKQ